MAFCQSCGSPLKDGQSFCQSCGAPVAQSDATINVPNNATNNTNPYYNPYEANSNGFGYEQNPNQNTSTYSGNYNGYQGSAPTSGKKKSGALPAIIAVALVVIAAVVVLLITKPFAPYSKAAKNLMKAYKNNNEESGMEIMYPEAYYQAFLDYVTDGDDSTGYTTDDIKEYFVDEGYVDFDLDVSNLTYNITKTKKMGKSYVTTLEDDLGFSMFDMDIDEAYKIYIRTTYKESGIKYKEDVVVISYKYDGKWYAVLDSDDE